MHGESDLQEDERFTHSLESIGIFFQAQANVRWNKATREILGQGTGGKTGPLHGEDAHLLLFEVIVKELRGLAQEFQHLIFLTHGSRNRSNRSGSEGAKCQAAMVAFVFLPPLSYSWLRPVFKKRTRK